MKRAHRSLIIAAVAGGLCGGVGLVRADWSIHSPPAHQLADHHKFPHMHNALDKLSQARSELDQAEDDLGGKKSEVIGHVDEAISEVKEGLKEQHEESAANLPTARKLDDRKWPHLHAAMERLREARDELQNADPVFAGHRDKAMEHLNKAIKQLEDSVR
jgi:DNA repair exonuclease SbcCD ATPase subunit